jgi:VIT1/CCC1 family predicted Fe2+/Mn2+ transporter
MPASVEPSESTGKIAQGQPARTAFRRPLEPIERISEVWFGLVMVLTFTCSLSVKSAGHEEVRAMLIAALGCNAAWGISDAFLYLLGSYVENGRGIAALRTLRATPDPGAAHQVISDALPPLIASTLSPTEFEAMRLKLSQVAVPARPTLTRTDWLGALGVFLLVFFSTFPVAVPFMVVGDARLALRISNGIALVMMFLTGYAFGRHADFRPLRMGLWMVLFGGLLVAMTIVLGG